MSANGMASSSYPLSAAGVGEAPERDDALVRAVLRAVEVTGAHTGSVFLLSGDHRSLVVAASCGTPPSLLSGWRRIPVNSRMPVAEACRSGRMVHLAGAEETMRRFPQLSIALPYPFGSASVPVQAGGRTFGAIAVVWTPRPDGTGLSRAQCGQLRSAADRLGTALAGLRARGTLGEYDERTAPVLVPLPSAPAVRVGLFDWNLDTGALTADDELCAIFGIAPRMFNGRAAILAACIEPGDLPGFGSAARAAVEEGHLLAHRLRILDGRGGHRVVELWGRVPESPDDSEASCHLVGAVLDSGSGMAAVAAIERLADGFFALSPDGRLSYANHSLEDLLRVRQDELLGRRPWDILPWLADPVYEDRYRAAAVSQQPVSFLVRRPPDEWLVFSLHPGAQGMTGWGSRVRQPVPAGTVPGAPVTEEGPPISSAPAPAAPRVGSLYRVLTLGSALTEAATADEVFDAVAEQLLPAFGGQKLAIAVVEARRLHLLAQRGYSKRFLARFEGTPLHARLPVTDALTSGVPLFVESREQLRESYPGLMVGHTNSWAFLPLIASNHPVGACILGFDDIHRFPDEERGVLTALGGLIGQALERARLYDAEFALARGLQDALLPHRLPTLPGLHVTGRYLPGTRGMDIGGDWYDVIPTGDEVALIVGDVEGAQRPRRGRHGPTAQRHAGIRRRGPPTERRRRRHQPAPHGPRPGAPRQLLLRPIPSPLGDRAHRPRGPSPAPAAPARRAHQDPGCARRPTARHRRDGTLSGVGAASRSRVGPGPLHGRVDREARLGHRLRRRATPGVAGPAWRGRPGRSGRRAAAGCLPRFPRQGGRHRAPAHRVRPATLTVPTATVTCPKSSGTPPGIPPDPRSWRRGCCRPC